jgi:hypothetical protein
LDADGDGHDPSGRLFMSEGSVVSHSLVPGFLIDFALSGTTLDDKGLNREARKPGRKGQKPEWTRLISSVDFGGVQLHEHFHRTPQGTLGRGLVSRSNGPPFRICHHIRTFERMIE